MKHVCVALFVMLLCIANGSRAQSIEDLGPAPLKRFLPGLPDEFVTGRVSAIACSATDAEKYYVSGPGGGVWRRDSDGQGGYYWTPLTDRMPMLAVGALALDPADESIIYAGTGDANAKYGCTVPHTLTL